MCFVKGGLINYSISENLSELSNRLPAIFIFNTNCSKMDELLEYDKKAPGNSKFYNFFPLQIVYVNYNLLRFMVQQAISNETD